MTIPPNDISHNIDNVEKKTKEESEMMKSGTICEECKLVITHKRKICEYCKKNEIENMTKQYKVDVDAILSSHSAFDLKNKSSWNDIEVAELSPIPLSHVSFMHRSTKHRLYKKKG